MPTLGVAEISRAELAWAAGFFEGEGSTIARADAARPGYRQLNITVPQTSRHGVPQVLLRFQRAMLGMGHVSGPDADHGYMLRFNAREEAHAVLRLLWPYLGEVKRTQAVSAMTIVDAQYREGTFRTRRPRKRAPALPRIAESSPAETEVAWASGFLDAEGCFGLNRGKRRLRGPVWYRIRLSADQHGVVGIIPGVLLRLQHALGGIGRIERHGRPDDYKWYAEGRAMVQHALKLTAPFLSEEKLSQAKRALARFDAQPRLKGNETHCLRGHMYGRIGIKGGRIRRICNACERITDRARRAALGIPPRAFKNPQRRYTQ